MQEKFDVVIAGGAVMGSSTAYHLLSNPQFRGEILVIDKDLTFQKSASALSASSIRQQYSTAINIRVSQFGIAFLRSISTLLAVDGERPDVGLSEGGYLYLAGTTGAQTLLENHALQMREGADTLLLEPAELSHRFPCLNLDGLVLGSFGRSCEGWFDGYGLMQAFRRKARSLGAVYRQDEVVGVSREGRQVIQVELAGGSRIACGSLVNTAGASGARQLAALAGATIPVFAKKRCVFAFTAASPPSPFPLLIDTTGVWCRPEGKGFICGVSPDDLDESDAREDFEVDWPLFEEVMWPALAHRVPAFETIRPGRAWACHYDTNLFDHNALAGKVQGLDNMFMAAGFSGHGLQQAPAIGRGLAELIIHGRYVTLDLADFACDRIAANRPLLEKNII
ncbi:MAG: FAD-binding oxidoreductase [Methylobacteriaceae bacterium]|nr:FAD-binding oxidoreductase [Methylobacteriaceae bacterium]